MANLAIALTVIILFQLILSVYQIQYYQRFVKRLVANYQGTNHYRLVSEVVKSLIASTIVILVINEEKKIVEAYYLKGLTIFSKFTSFDKIIGEKLNEHLIDSVKGENHKAIQEAIESLVVKNN
ncbi:transcriptional regulator GutM [Streptococcus orisasini]|uniref:transcriptional regulator GutM n=1 Tax=Streptococcus orisasini TaxID=1080071 RepID=UPI000710B05E|nr:transcriptional regulator GutM [Streptococcus orisasini]